MEGHWAMVDTNNSKPMYKVGEITHAASNNEPYLLLHNDMQEGPAMIMVV